MDMDQQRIMTADENKIYRESKDNQHFVQSISS